MDDARDRRLRRLYYRSNYRGTHENDLLLGRFAERHLDGMTDAELDQYEALLEQSDTDLFNWITGREQVPDDCDSDVIRALCRFHGRSGD